MTLRSLHRPLPSSALLLCAVLALAACRPDADTSGAAGGGDAAQATAAPAAADVPATPAARDPLLEGSDAVAIEHHARPEPPGFDRRAFAGTFAGTLPCAGCPSGDARLRIDADGGFRLDEGIGGGGEVQTAGTWSVDAGSRRLLLDPEVKDAPDRHFAIASNDELRMLDPDGNELDGAPGHGLRRD
jgi:copper homeostasis protein (lipoprotein)